MKRNPENPSQVFAGRVMRMNLLLVLASLTCLQPAIAQELFRSGGGVLAQKIYEYDCISPEQRARVEQNIARYHARHGFSYRPSASSPGRDTTDGPALYPFHPQAGNLWGDLFVNNFTDLDPTSGIRDWDCTDFTYNGHRGHDVDLRAFDEQEIGVPIFAALDGIVVEAHDGEWDRSVDSTPKPANYVILWHGGTHYSWYWHMKRDSVAVALNQEVRAGTQLGLTGSSGISTYPHLHFESRYNGTWYEPYAGHCRPGPSFWVSQIPIRRQTYLRDFNITDVRMEDYGSLPYERPRAGTFVLGTRSISFWINIHNQPADSTRRIKFVRPDGSVRYDSGTASLNPSAYRWAWWWWRYNINFDVTGTWRIEFSLNGQLLESAPFEVVASADEIVNRPPHPVTAALDPAAPTASDVIFCGVGTSLTLDDPDYDVVRYRYQWAINGNVVRDVTTAAHSDAIPHSLAQPGDVVECTVTPSDGSASGPSSTASVSVEPAPATLASLSLSADTLTGGDSSTGTVTLNLPAPEGGAEVSLSSSDASAATVPESVTVEAGASEASFTVTTNALETTTTVTITASYNGASQEATLTVEPAPHLGDQNEVTQPLKRLEQNQKAKTGHGAMGRLLGESDLLGSRCIDGSQIACGDVAPQAWIGGFLDVGQGRRTF